MLEGYIDGRVNGKRRLETRGRRPIRATHHVSKTTSETQTFLTGYEDQSWKDEYAVQAEEARKADDALGVGWPNSTVAARKPSG
jgi:hypothetical protein